jgi:ABC-type antimicrobial peptide transport system permease subunit
VVTTVRRRSRELAVLRALGMTQQQSRVAVATHATLLGVIGILVGLPLGLALGRTVWRAVAHETPFQYIAPLAATTLAILVPATLLLANALAAVPGQMAARMRLAQVLRAE